MTAKISAIERAAADGTASSRNCGKPLFLVSVLVMLLLSNTDVLGADSGDSALVGNLQPKPAKVASVPARYRVYSLKHISAERAKQYLAQVEIGTVSQLADANMLLVTAQPRELVKSDAIMGLVDSRGEFVIRAISAVSADPNYPYHEQVAAEIGDILIGTFSNPPMGVGVAKAIVDVHNGGLIVAAPQSQIDKIISAVPTFQKTDTEVRLPVEPAVPEEVMTMPAPVGEFATFGDMAASAAPVEANEAESDGIFGRLLESLAEAEKKAAEREGQVSEPNESDIVTIPAEPCQPTVAEALPGPLVPTEPLEPVVPVEAVEKPAELTKDEALALILRRLEALEAGLRAKSGPKLQPLTQVPAEAAPKIVSTMPLVPGIEPPNEVNVPPAPRIEHPNEVNVPSAGTSIYEPESLPNGGAVLDMDLPEDLPLANFLEFAGKQLQLNLLYKPEQMKTFKVTIRLRGDLKGPMTVKELYETLRSVLQFYGFTMTRRGSLVIVRPLVEAGESDAPIVRDEGDRPNVGDVIVTRVFDLEHVSTSSAKNLLTGMKLGIGEPREIPETGTLIVTGFAHRMPRIEQLLELIDKPGEPKRFRFRQLKYTMAQTLAPKVKSLVEQLGEISITVAQPAPVPGRPTPGRTRPRPPRPSRGRPTPPTPPAGQPAAPAEPGQPTVYLDFDERTNRILMIGFDDELDIVEDLINTLDVEQQDLRSMRLYQIKHVDAEEVRMKLEELGIITVTRAVSATGRFRRDRLDRTRPGRTARPGQPATPAGTATPTAATSAAAGATTEEPLVEEPQVVILESINSLLVNATAEQHARIATIIGYVDSVSEERDIPYVVYPLENQDPVELAETLNKLILETTERQEKEAKIVQQQRRTEEEIIIIADPKTYSLIVYASKRNQQWISALIRQLDEYRPQVLLDVTLVEITKNEEFTLDLNVISSFPDLSATSGLTGVIKGSGEDAITIGDILGGLNGRDRFIDLQSRSGDGTAFYGDHHINALLEAIQTKDYGRILARPKLLVNDNEKGTITSQETIHITRERTTFRKGTVGDQGGVGDIPITDVEFLPYDAGITLDIEPHISKGEQLRLTIIMTRKDFRLTGDTATLAKPPDIVTSDVATVVTVPDNRTIILGGLEKLSQTKGGSKVPFLGDLPLIGIFFKGTSNIDKQSRLYVFVKAHILRPGEPMDGKSDIELVSASNRNTFEKYEKEMQEYEDWPGIKPTPMDPLRILDGD